MRYFLDEIEISESEYFNLLSQKAYIYKEIPDGIVLCGRETRISELKNMLHNSDYIVSKIAEALSENDYALVAQIRDEYRNELEQRKQCRAEINALEAEINALG